MVALFTPKKVGPIGVDLGSRAVKLVQLSGDRSRVIEAARWDLPLENQPGSPACYAQLTEALKQAREGRKFRGREVVLCLGSPELYVQNVRVIKPPEGPLDNVVWQEAEGRLPFPAAETELRYLEAGDVRQGDTTRREVIVLACHRPVLDQILQSIEDAGLRPIAVEVEPLALLRCYNLQFRRDADQNQRTLFVHVGHANTSVIIAQGAEAIFVKYLDLGGKHLDEAVSRHLKMELADAATLRRHNGDRRADQQDPDIARSVAESIRPVVDKLAGEVALCVRYHSVTFRSQQLKRLVLAGGEATQALADTLATRTELKCELGDPLRSFEQASAPGRKSQWDVAVGLALRATK
jgi:type IV pilus assembly protein PilM